MQTIKKDWLPRNKFFANYDVDVIEMSGYYHRCDIIKNDIESEQHSLEDIKKLCKLVGADLLRVITPSETYYYVCTSKRYSDKTTKPYFNEILANEDGFIFRYEKNNEVVEISRENDLYCIKTYTGTLISGNLQTLNKFNSIIDAAFFYYNQNIFVKEKN